MSQGAVAGQSTGGKFLRIFGFSGAEEASERGAAASPADARSPGSPYKAARRDLMARITDFLVENDLDLTPTNLLVTHSALSGADLNLARKFAEKQTSGEAINQEWLDSLADKRGGDQSEKGPELDNLVTKLQSSIEAFTHTTRFARTAAADYNTELERHAGQMDDYQSTGKMLTSLAELTKAMLERTRQVEEDMKRSEQEATSLRKSLEKAQREAEVDHLTGLPNRRAFEGLLEIHFREAQKQIEPLCVAFCDIDHFKRVNDTHGHDTGDRVIQAIGQVLSRVSNEKCHVARHGGEEFVMLFRGLTKREAQERLDEAREAMAARNFVNRATDEPIGKITFSGGIADVFAFPDTRTALRAADEALYRAKEAGRNRIELA